MSFKVKTIPKFEAQLKRLAKRYPSLKSEFFELVQSLRINPTQGTSLGQSCFKIRLPIASKGKGKSGGGRVITCYQVSETTVFLIAIFDKSERESMPDRELKDLLKEIL